MTILLADNSKRMVRYESMQYLKFQDDIINLLDFHQAEKVDVNDANFNLVYLTTSPLALDDGLTFFGTFAKMDGEELQKINYLDFIKANDEGQPLLLAYGITMNQNGETATVEDKLLFVKSDLVGDVIQLDTLKNVDGDEPFVYDGDMQELTKDIKFKYTSELDDLMAELEISRQTHKLAAFVSDSAIEPYDGLVEDGKYYFLHNNNKYLTPLKGIGDVLIQTGVLVLAVTKEQAQALSALTPDVTNEPFYLVIEGNYQLEGHDDGRVEYKLIKRSDMEDLIPVDITVFDFAYFQSGLEYTLGHLGLIGYEVEQQEQPIESAPVVVVEEQEEQHEQEEVEEQNEQPVQPKEENEQQEQDEQDPLAGMTEEEAEAFLARASSQSQSE